MRQIVVTGGGQGIGRGLIRCLLDAGDSVLNLDLHAAEMSGVTDHPCYQWVACDITKSDSVTEALAVTGWDRVDVLVNCASIFSTLTMKPFWDIDDEEWRRVVDVNLTGGFIVTKAVLPYLRQSVSGRIIHFGSAAVPMGRPNYMHYVSAKAGVVGMTRAMARELGPMGITVNAILPGATVTEVERETVSPDQMRAMLASRALARTQQIDDLTGVVVFLASDAARFMTGQAIIVDGGLVFNGA